MKILVPSDFSECASYALDSAIQIAKKLNAEIHIFHSANIPTDWKKIPDSQDQLQALYKSIDERAMVRISTLKNHVLSEGIQCITKIVRGKLIKTIGDYIKTEYFDLIVMGSHGISGKNEWFIGSNTQKVVRKLHKNILVVKDEMKELDFSNVLFVTGLNIEDQAPFKYFLSFISNFNVKEVHIMSVNTKGVFSQPTILIEEVLKDFKKIAKGFKVHTHFYSDYSIDAGVRHFSEKYDINLIAISNHKRHPFKRIFQGSNVEMIVNHSQVPVLSIDY